MTLLQVVRGSWYQDQQHIHQIGESMLWSDAMAAPAACGLQGEMHAGRAQGEAPAPGPPLGWVLILHAAGAYLFGGLADLRMLSFSSDTYIAGNSGTIPLKTTGCFLYTDPDIVCAGFSAGFRSNVAWYAPYLPLPRFM